MKQFFKDCIRLIIGVPTAFLVACCVLLSAGAVIVLGAVFITVLAIVFAVLIQLSPILTFFGINTTKAMLEEKAEEIKKAAANVTDLQSRRT
jgi:hypothetical protein